jgi:cell pole-organizing protein PopZ
MSKSTSHIGLLLLMGTIAIAATSCSGGASKITQCSSIATVVKEVVTAAKELDTPVNKDSAKEAKLFSDMAVKMQGFSKKLQAVEIQDQKLKGYQSSFAQTYQDYAKAFDKLAPSMKSKDQKAIDKGIVEMNNLSTKESALGKEMAKYCTSK